MEDLRRVERPRAAKARQADADATRHAYEWLSSVIVSGEREPVSPIRIEALRQESGVGVSALREALIQLEAEQLVVSEHNRGFRVAPMSIADLQDTNRTRIMVEGEALRQSIAAGDVAWEGRVVSALHQLLRQPHYGSDLPESEKALDWERCHKAFHSALIDACPSLWLRRFSQSLDPHYQRYRRYVWRHSGPEHVTRTRDKVAEEHQQLADAAINRRSDEAVAILTAHYQRSTEMLIAICSQHPGLLEG